MINDQDHCKDIDKDIDDDINVDHHNEKVKRWKKLDLFLINLKHFLFSFKNIY